MKCLILRLLCLAIFALIGYGYGAWQHERGLRAGVRVGLASGSIALDDCRRLAVEEMARADSCEGRGQ